MPPSIFQVTVTEATMEYVKSKLQTGDYATEGDVIDEMVTAAREDEVELEQWLRDVAVPAYKSFLADPSTGIPLDQVKAELEEEIRQFDEQREWP